jgi:hypothetical protein
MPNPAGRVKQPGLGSRSGFDASIAPDIRPPAETRLQSRADAPSGFQEGTMAKKTPAKKVKDLDTRKNPVGGVLSKSGKKGS